ncbi:MAG: hypothetical protein ABIE74_12805 [Pseudomonadota bacterium]
MKKFYALLVLVSLVTVAHSSEAASKKLPAPNQITGNNFRCSSLMDTKLSTDEKVTKLKSSVIDNSKDMDAIMEISRKVLTIKDEMGMAVKWKIISNDANTMIAQNVGRTSIETLLLNKKSGLIVGTSSVSGSVAPTVESHYMSCKLLP